MSVTNECPKCGKEVEPGSRFCPDCGSDVSGEQGQAKTAVLTMTNLEDQLMEMLRQATLGDFEILKELGRGGMAMVYLAHDISLNRKVAIKVMSPALGVDKSMAERFKREAQTAASLSHPNIIPVYAVKDTGDICYFVMKFIAGRPLDDIMEEVGPMPIEMAKAVLIQTAAALGYGHKRGIVHRDVKPGNVMIDDEGYAVMTDFGIAKVESAGGLTQTGAAIGTPTYMSPEQCTAREVTGASDQYSLGVMAYEMLTGRKPFAGDSIMTIMYGHVNEAPPSFLDDRPECPPELHEVIMKMMAKKAEDRFEDMDAVIAAMDATPMAHNDPVRTEMMTLAASGISAKLLSQVNTPRSPIPNMDKISGKRTSIGDKAVTDPGAATQLTSDSSPDLAPAEPKKSKKGLLVAGIVLVLAAAGGVLAVTQPWSSGTAADNDPNESAAASPPAQPSTEGAATPALERIDVSLSNETVPRGQQVFATAAGFLSDGSPVDTTVTWSSSDQTVARVDAVGTVTTVGNGSATITASLGGVRGESQLTVNEPPPATEPARPNSIAIAGLPTAMEIGESHTGRATVYDQRGQPMNRQVSWSSSNDAVAQVGSNGAVRAVGAGSAEIRANLGSVSQSYSIRVSAPAVDQIALSQANVSLETGSTASLSVTIRDTRNNLVDRQSDVRWTSSDASTASVSSSGVVTAVSAGSATITAALDGVTATAQISVRDPEPTGPTVAESQAEIRQVLANLERAMETRDLEQVRAVWPSMSAEFETAWRDAFEVLEALDVRYELGEISVNGDRASVPVRVTNITTVRGAGRNRADPVDQVAQFALQNGSWVLTSFR